MRLALASCLAVSLLTACATQEPAPPAENSPLVGNEWVAREIGARPVLEATPATLLVKPDGSVSGKSGCNGFAGASSVVGDSLTFGELMSTKMGCPEPQMDQESRYFQALGATKRYLLEDNTLRLLDGGGATVVLYTR